MSDALVTSQPRATTHEVPDESVSLPATTSPELSGRCIAGVVALFVIIGHAWSVNTGLYLDDYAHFEHLRDGDWSYRSAVDSARLGIVGEVLDLWGRQEAGLRFYRPIAFWIMRAEYTLVGWNPLGMHVLSLGWHFACSMLVGAVAARALGRRFWGLVAACLMAIHPAHVGTVYWIACQTELLTTLFLLLGILAYARYAGWGDCWFHREREQNDAATRGRGDAAKEGEAEHGSRGSFIYAMIAMVCYGLALGCRENAALFPLVCWLGDRLIGTSRPRWIRWDHVAMGLVFVLYMVLRYEALGGFPVPPPPYLEPVSASLEFVQYVLYKIVMYALGLFLFVPVVPVGSRSYFAERLDVFYGLFVAVLALIAVIWAAYRFRPSLLWPLVWLGCLIAPVMLVFASPHHLYLPGLGMVLLFTAGIAAIAGRSPGSPRAGIRAVVCGCIIFILAVGLGLYAWSMGFAYVRGVLSEDLVVREVKRQVKPLRDGDHLFFINLPVLAYYVVPAIEQELGYRDLKGHVLVFSPDLIRMESPGEVEVLDRHRLRIRAPADKPYLAGTTGTMLLGVMGIDRNLRQGQQIDAGLFTVTLTKMDDEGVRELLYEFREPLDSPNYHFYLGSPQFMAYELIFPHAAATSQPGP
ncbi:MAG TPA: hypothetical protein PK458_18415 [Phycisphaerae bacterium]|nr:hypothetical protein [Phycisphaerae bacterium]